MFGLQEYFSKRRLLALVRAAVILIGLNAMFAFGAISRIPSALHPILDATFVSSLIFEMTLGIAFYGFLAKIFLYGLEFVVGSVWLGLSSKKWLSALIEKPLRFVESRSLISTIVVGASLYFFYEFRMSSLANYIVGIVIIGLFMAAIIGGASLARRDREEAGWEDVVQERIDPWPLAVVVSASLLSVGAFMLGKLEIEERANLFDFDDYAPANKYLIGSTSQGLIFIRRISQNEGYQQYWCFSPNSGAYFIVARDAWRRLEPVTLERDKGYCADFDDGEAVESKIFRTP